MCQLTGTKANNGMAVSHSHIRTKKLQQANLQQRRLWWAEGKRCEFAITTRALKTIQKKGLGAYAKSLELIWPVFESGRQSETAAFASKRHRGCPCNHSFSE